MLTTSSKVLNTMLFRENELENFLNLHRKILNAYGISKTTICTFLNEYNCQRKTINSTVFWHIASFFRPKKVNRHRVGDDRDKKLSSLNNPENLFFGLFSISLIYYNTRKHWIKNSWFLAGLYIASLFSYSKFCYLNILYINIRLRKS